MPEAVHQFSTGAVRSTDADNVRYDLISPIALDEIAKTYAEGSAKYGDHNWLKGMPVSDLLNHSLRHVYMFLSGDRSEPHLAHAGWGLMAAIHSEKQWPHLNENLLGPGCTPPSDGPAVTYVTKPSGSLRATDFPKTNFDAAETPAASPGGQCAGCESPGMCSDLYEYFGSPCVLCPADPGKKRPHRIPRLNDPRDGSVPPPVLYLSGPMSGLEKFNFPAFNEAAEKLRQMGFPVLNPADFGWEESDWAKNLARDLALLGNAQILIQLPGWEYSRGASLEYSTAVSLGLGVASLSEVLDLA